AAGAEPRGFRVAVEHVEPDRFAIEIGEAGEIARLEADRADAQRRAVREGDGGGGVGGVHRDLSLFSLYWGAAVRNNRERCKEQSARAQTQATLRRPVV